MADTKVAHRFAKSLIGLSRERNVSEKIFGDVQLIRSTIRNNRGLSAMLRNPIAHNYKKLAVLREIFSGKIDSLTMSFIELVVKKNREPFLYEIASAFVTMYNEGRGIRSANVTTAVALDDQLRSQLLEIVKKDTGGQVEMTEKVDQDIIGGYILRWDDKQIDASVKKKLNDLRMEFSK